MSKACVAGMTSRQGQNRHRILWDIKEEEVVHCESSTPEIVWISGIELDKPCPSVAAMKITSKSRARCSLGLSFNAKLNTVPMYLPASFTPFFYSPTQEINLFSLFLYPSFFLYFMRPQPELNLDCWVTERLTVKGRERERREKGEMKEKELGRWWAPPQLQPAESFQLAHNC